MFWLLSLLIVVVFGLWVLWPLLRGDSRFKVTGLLVLLALPLLVYWQYQIVGSPRALQVSDMPVLANTDASLDDLIASLREKLTETPADLEGWVLLARSYKTLQDYPAALSALETANRLVPNEPVVLVELVEARLFASGNPVITPEMIQLLEQAVAQQEGLQKGWWLLGLAAAQQGDDETAITHWRKLLQNMEPGSPAAQTIQTQIAEAEARLQAAGGTSKQESDQPWQSALINVELGANASEQLAALPPTAVLFLIARPVGETSGPPLAVRRINQPGFPLEISLTDADSMLPQRPVSGFGELQVQARLSLTGEAKAASGDWQSAAVRLSIEDTEPLRLQVDQLLE